MSIEYSTFLGPLRCQSIGPTGKTSNTKRAIGHRWYGREGAVTRLTIDIWYLSVFVHDMVYTGHLTCVIGALFDVWRPLHGKQTV